MKTIQFILVAMLISSSLYGQFETCNSQTSRSLNDVHFIDHHIGIAVGDSGTIIRSIDGGNNWTKIIEIDSITFTKVKFWDEVNGIAVGSDVFTTTDGGVNWIHQDISNDFLILDVELFDDGKALLSTQELQFGRGENKVVQIQLIGNKVNILFEKLIAYNITHMDFIDDFIGYAHHFEGSIVNSILHTKDGGLNWDRINFETGEDITIIEDIHFISADIGFKGGWYNPHLMKTTDGGLNWRNVTIKDSKTTIFDLPNLLDFHIDRSRSNIFYACGWHGELFKSNDLGSTWEKLASPVPIGTSIKGIYFINDSIGWAVGDYGIVIKTSNGGQLTSTKGFSKHEIDIYPVPFDDVIHLDLPVTAFKTVNLYNVTGQLLRSSEDNTIENLETLTTGFYLLTIELDHSIQIFKVLKN